MDVDHTVKSQKLAVEPLKRLPEETILEILGKLPLKDLLVFRCVSKSWYKDPKCTEMTKKNFSLMLIVNNKVRSLDNYTLSSSSLVDGLKGHVEKIHCPFMDSTSDFDGTNIVGSCRGLFCIYSRRGGRDYESLCLWNPSTKETRFRPCSEFRRIEEKMRFALCGARGHGFGYDSESDDYKYMCIVYLNSQTEVHIYSFRMNSWKQMYIPYVLINENRCNRSPNGVFCNGALHWFASEESVSYTVFLLAFDMTEGDVRKIPQPENLDIVKKYDEYVEVLDGCLCILYSNFVGFQVWTMKDYGMRESWTMMYNIPELTLPEFKSFVSLRRIECLKNGKFLLEVHSTKFLEAAALVLYDPNNKTAPELKLSKSTMLSVSQVRSLSYRYVKTSVKLNFGSDVEEGT